jgi:hypothetical protein
MNDEIVNITRKVVNQKIETIVKNPSTPYDSAFANPTLRQKLMLRVLNHATPRYTSSTGQGISFNQIKPFSLTQEEEKQIESIIQENILKILQEEDVIKHFTVQKQASCPQEPSHWFG